MKLGMVGLGKMGGNMAERLRTAGHDVVGYDRNPDTSDVADLPALVEALGDAPRAVWIMVPSGEPTDKAIAELAGLLGQGDVVVDGGNTFYRDSLAHADELGAKGVGFIDAGVSGGIWGRDNGYALMVGGDAAHVAVLQPAFDALRPPGDNGGFAHVGPVGTGHYSKMVHNGIEYGLMHAYGEGYELLTASDLDIDADAVLRSWREGSVVRSWLLELLCRALDADPKFEGIAGYATDSGEGRWTVNEAVRLAVPLPVISAALFARFASRQEDSPALKAVAALRTQFGGHSSQAIDRRMAETSSSPASEQMKGG